MAGYVKLSRSIWTDKDFIALPASAQRLYILIISQPDISHVGIVPLMPGRWERFAADTPADELAESLRVLEAHGFVVVDRSTHELWVRSYIIHDEAFRLTNGKKSLLNAYDKVYSDHIRSLICVILARVDVTVDSTVDATVDLSQQPAANSQQPKNQQPAADVVGDPLSFLSAEQRARAAAALEKWFPYRLAQPDVKKPSRLEPMLRQDAPKEHHANLARVLSEDPDASVEDLCVYALKMPRYAVKESA